MAMRPLPAERPLGKPTWVSPGAAHLPAPNMYKNKNLRSYQKASVYDALQNGPYIHQPNLPFYQKSSWLANIWYHYASICITSPVFLYGGSISQRLKPEYNTLRLLLQGSTLESKDTTLPPAPTSTFAIHMTENDMSQTMLYMGLTGAQCLM